MAVELPSSDSDVQALLESAVSSRASHIRRESETITMANVRRLLESDLGLETSALDVHKTFIRQLVDQVLLSSDDIETQGDEYEKEVSEEEPKKTSGSKRLKKGSGKKTKEKNGSVEDFEDLQEEDVQKESPKKKQQKEKIRKTSSKEDDEDGGGSSEEISEEDMHLEAPKKKQRKEKNKEDDEDGGGSNEEISEEDMHVEAPKKKQRKEKNKEERSHGKEVDDDGSGSHAEMSEEDSDVCEVKKAKKVSPKAVNVKPAQNKKIEHLKKIIKACGLSIPPQIYKRVKQQPDDKQDKFLIKELGDILSRRGLSSNPSDKEIKAVKQKLAKEKDLEGIDTTNIILEPRGRRAASQLFAPVYNAPPVEYDSEEDGEEESEDEDGGEGSEEEGKDFVTAEDLEDSD